MRIACLADSHFHDAPGGRFDECNRIHSWMVDDFDERGVDLVLHAGDVWERKPTPAEIHAAADFFEHLSADSITVRGNHDPEGMVAVLGRMRGHGRIISAETPCVEVTAGVAVACLPWPSKGQLLKALGRPVSAEESNEAAREALQAILRGLGDMLDDVAGDRPRILLSHAMVRGSVTSTGQPLVGCDFEIGLEDLALVRADAYVLGHIHKAQTWTIDGAPVFYPGSPRRTAFGESEGKGYRLLDISHDVDGSRFVSANEFIETPATPMVHVEAEWTTDPNPYREDDEPTHGFDYDQTSDDSHVHRGAEVRFRYSVPADERDAAKAAAEEMRKLWLEVNGAASVKVEEVVKATTRARAERVAQAETLADKLQAYWEVKGDVPQPERAARLIDKALDLERRVGATGRSHRSSSMRLDRLRGKGFGLPGGEFDVDLSELGRLVALRGKNGAGKTRFCELWLGATHRQCPTHGPLGKLADERDSYVEAWIQNGAPWTIRQTVDAVSGKAESLVLDDAGNVVPAVESAKVTAYKTWRDEHLPPMDVLKTSVFGAQGALSFLDMNPGDRKGVILRVKGVEYYEELAEAARKEATAAKGRLDVCLAKLETERDNGGDVDVAEKALDNARTEADAAAKALETARQELEAARQQAREYEEAEQNAAELAKRAQDMRFSLEAKRSDVGIFEQKIANNRGLLDRADEIREAAKLAETLRGSISSYETQIEKEKGSQQTAAAERQAASERVEVAERALDDAKKRRAEAVRAVEQAELKAKDLQRRLGEREQIEAAAAALPGLRKARDAAERAEAEAAKQLEWLRGQALLDADGRILHLRDGLEVIVSEDVDPEAQARTTLSEDDTAVAEAAEMPGKIAAAQTAKTRAAEAHVAARKKARDAELLASRLDGLKAAERDHEEARQAVEAAAAVAVGKAAEAEEAANAVAEARDALKAADATVVAHERAVAQLAGERLQLLSQLFDADETAKNLEHLNRAEARVEELQPQLTAAREEVDQIEAEIAALPAAPEMPATRPVIGAYEREVGERENLSIGKARRVTLAEKALQDAQEAGERIATLEAERRVIETELADWRRLAADLGRDGLQAIEVDAAGPELTELANSLLHECVSTRWTLSIETTRDSADGKKQIEGCEVMVLDTETGETREGSKFSGGQKVLIDAACRAALTEMGCRASGLRGVTLVCDETGAALDPENSVGFIAMLRRLAERVDASHVLFVSHNSDTWGQADSQLVFTPDAILVE